MADVTATLADDLQDLIAAARHFEDLEVFAGQRSRMHPGPGWAIVLAALRADLAAVRGRLAEEGINPTPSTLL